MAKSKTLQEHTIFRQLIIVTTLQGIKIAPFWLCNNLIKLRSSMSVFASSYLNKFVAKQCKNVTFADQVFFTVTVQNSILFSKNLSSPHF